MAVAFVKAWGCRCSQVPKGGMAIDCGSRHTVTVQKSDSDDADYVPTPSISLGKGEGHMVITYPKMLRAGIIAISCTVFALSDVRADVVTEWNERAGEVVVRAQMGPLPAERRAISREATSSIDSQPRHTT